ncbi:MAG: Hsp20/alpha crystallin family protein [Fuerstiella sp.]|nr:Hsp20/alpha crystallin family protein [Fuerstiella sp.]
MSNSDQAMRPTPPEVEMTPEHDADNSPRMLFNPPIDIYETSNGLVLYADLPGVTTEGLDLQVQDNRLAIFGRVRNDQDGRTVLHEEYKVGDFLRSFILSDEVDHEHITARLNNGVLRVELPRTQRSEPRRIQVSKE